MPYASTTGLSGTRVGERLVRERRSTRREPQDRRRLWVLVSRHLELAGEDHLEPLGAALP
eukprot:scaffold34524_cov38-Tisochrysis_lutea.AAC.1